MTFSGDRHLPQTQAKGSSYSTEERRYLFTSLGEGKFKLECLGHSYRAHLVPRAHTRVVIKTNFFKLCFFLFVLVDALRPSQQLRSAVSLKSGKKCQEATRDTKRQENFISIIMHFNACCIAFLCMLHSKIDHSLHVLVFLFRQWLLTAGCHQRIRYCQPAVTSEFAADSQYNLCMILGFYMYSTSDFIWPFLQPYKGVIPNPKMAFIFPFHVF